MPSLLPSTPIPLSELASVIRSKNAGPLTLSFDLMFREREAYERAVRAPGLTPEALALLFRRAPGEIQVTPYAAAQAIKIAMPRAVVSGSPGDRDVYGAQQHLPLLGIPV